MIQVRYGENSPIAKKLRSEFRSTWEYVETSKALPENINRKVTIKVPTDIQEYLVFNASAVPIIKKRIFASSNKPNSPGETIHQTYPTAVKGHHGGIVSRPV